MKPHEQKFQRGQELVRSGLALQQEAFDELEALYLRDTGSKVPEPRPQRPPAGKAAPEVRVEADGCVSSVVYTDAEEYNHTFTNGLHIRVYRTEAGGAWRIGVVIANGSSSILHLNGLDVQFAGRLGCKYDGHWCLDPGQAWVRVFYIGVEEAYWRSRAASILAPVPEWADERLRGKLVSLITWRCISPFRLDQRSDANEGGADFGVSVAGPETWLSPMGILAMEEWALQGIQRHRCFYMDEDGEPVFTDLWEELGEYYWQTWQHPRYQPTRNDREAAEAWWPDYAKLSALGDYDGQHSPRAGWRVFGLLRDIDPLSKWLLSHTWNRAKHQFMSSQAHRTNPLFRGLPALIDRTGHGRGSPMLGREGWWAAEHARLARDARATVLFSHLIVSAQNGRECQADPSPDYPNGVKARAKDGGIYPDDAPLCMAHEVGIGSMVVRWYGIAGLSDNMANLVRNATGKVKAFGELEWRVGDPLPYLNMLSGDFSRDGGSAVEMLEIASRRDPFDSGNPLIQCPRRFWEQEVSRG